MGAENSPKVEEGKVEGADVCGGGGTGVELGAPGENVEHFFGRTRGGSGKTNTNNYFAVFESSTESRINKYIQDPAVRVSNALCCCLHPGRGGERMEGWKDTC